MADFELLHDQSTNNWVISAPRRSKRPNIADGFIPACPFCPAQIQKEPALYEVTPTATSQVNDEDDHSQNIYSWLIRVVANKYPFADIHEVIILSPEHRKSFESFTLDQTERVLKAYRQRFQTHEAQGQVYIFHNHGQKAGESIPHPHTQLAVLAANFEHHIPPPQNAQILPIQELQETDRFLLFCPRTSQWPDEVWLTPKRKDTLFGESNDDEVNDMAFVLNRLVKILTLRHGHEFPYNFYIYPGKNWYLRLIPRLKTLGGFEVGTEIYINTQDPLETIRFIKEHFTTPDEEKIKRDHQATYHHSV